MSTKASQVAAQLTEKYRPLPWFVGAWSEGPADESKVAIFVMRKDVPFHLPYPPVNGTTVLVYYVNEQGNVVDPPPPKPREPRGPRRTPCVMRKIKVPMMQRKRRREDLRAFEEQMEKAWR